MHIAIFGANSQIAQDLTRSLAAARTFDLSLFDPLRFGAERA